MPIPKSLRQRIESKLAKKQNERRVRSYQRKIKRRENIPVRILLSSYGLEMPTMREKFSKVIPQDRSLRRKTCVILPYAGSDSFQTGELEKQNLIDYGFSKKNVYVANDYGSFKYNFPDYIYVSGGDPFKLLKHIRRTNLWSSIAIRVNKHKAVFIGVSAGAYMTTKDIKYVMQLEDNNVIFDDNFKALELISESVLCHYDHYSYSKLKACQEESEGPIITINDDQLIMFKNGEWEYI